MESNEERIIQLEQEIDRLTDEIIIQLKSRLEDIKEKAKQSASHQSLNSVIMGGEKYGFEKGKISIPCTEEDKREGTWCMLQLAKYIDYKNKNQSKMTQAQPVQNKNSINLNQESAISIPGINPTTPILSTEPSLAQKTTAANIVPEQETPTPDLNRTAQVQESTFPESPELNPAPQDINQEDSHNVEVETAQAEAAPAPEINPTLDNTYPESHHGRRFRVVQKDKPVDSKSYVEHDETFDQLAEIASEVIGRNVTKINGNDVPFTSTPIETQESESKAKSLPQQETVEKEPIQENQPVSPIVEPVTSIEKSQEETTINPIPVSVATPENPVATEPLPAKPTKPLPQEEVGDILYRPISNTLDYQKMAVGLVILRNLQSFPTIQEEKARALVEQEIEKQSKIVKNAREVVPQAVQKELERQINGYFPISKISPELSDFIHRNSIQFNQNDQKLLASMDTAQVEIDHLIAEKNKLYASANENDQKSEDFQKKVQQLDQFYKKACEKQYQTSLITNILTFSSITDTYFKYQETKLNGEEISPELQKEMDELIGKTTESSQLTAQVTQNDQPTDASTNQDLDLYFSDEELAKMIEDLKNQQNDNPQKYQNETDNDSSQDIDSTSYDLDEIQTIIPQSRRIVLNNYDAPSSLIGKVQFIASQIAIRVQDYVSNLLHSIADGIQRSREENFEETNRDEEYSEIEGVSYYELFDTIQDWMNEFNTDVQVSPEQVNNYISKHVSFSKPGQSLDEFESKDIPSSDDYCLIMIDPETEEDTGSIEIRPEIENSSVHKASDGPVYAHIPTHILQLVEQKRENEDYTQSHSAK